MTRMKFYFSFLLILVALSFQGCSIKARIKKADKRFAIGEYSAAAQMYYSLAPAVSSKDKPLKSRIAFNQAECYRLTNHNRAEQTYLTAIRNLYPDTIVYLRYAQVQQQNGKYADAAKNYAIYLKKDSTNEVAISGVLTAKMVAEWRNNSSRYLVRKVPEFNSTRSSTFCPAFMGSTYDGLMFSTTRPLNKKAPQKNSAITGFPTNKMFTTRKNAVGKWETPILLEGEVNTINDEGVCSLTPDGKVMYYTRSPIVAVGEKGTDIYMTNRAGGTWSAPQRIKIFKDSTISVAHPAIAPDGQTLYFVSNAKDGLGGKDIWKATIDKGECKFIENLGTEINTQGDEMFPSVRADGTLYYSTNGKPGFGGLDIFRATPLKSGGWKVENMGLPINSNADDFGITFFGNAERGFFSTNRGDTKGYDAVWSFELPELAYTIEGKVFDEKGVIIPDASVRMVSNTGINTRVQSKKDGTYRMKLDKDMDCVMLASARGYLNQKNKLNTQGLTTSKTFKVDFVLSSITKPVKMDNIFYEFGRWELTPASASGLQVLVKLLNDNPNITIEISANTDFVGNNAANKALSEKRAKSVVDYLIATGIATDRLTSVGNGEENPVVVDVTLAKKYLFLKEGDVLDENTILKFTLDQQEAANQINRRTEFRVLKTTYKLY